MRITVVAVGRLKERYWRDACDEYLKRLRRYADMHEVEVADRESASDPKRALAEEGADIRRAIPDGSYTIALDIKGKVLSSEGIAQKLAALALEGRSNVTMVIGGSNGIDDALLQDTDLRLSLGAITLPHNLARVVVLEQLYRAFRIQRGEPYHK